MYITEHRLKIPMLRACCHIVICEDLQAANNKLKLVDDNLDGVGAYTNTKFIKGWALMILTPNNTAGEITHECCHFVNAIFHKMGYELDTSNDEFQSYLLAYIVDEVHDYIKHHDRKTNKCKITEL